MRFIDRYFYNPSFLQKLLAIALLPISIIYLTISTLRRKFSVFIDFKIPIISVGNLVVGGSGKTPFLIEVAKNYKDVAIISRGYKRKSKGLVVVSQNGKILVEQKQAGDEPYLMAKLLPNATIIVSKDRAKAIIEAKNMGCKIIFLDDGFRFSFKKLNILLRPKLKPYFNFCIPSGIYRENPSLYCSADILVREGIEYSREISIEDKTPNMILLTAIANPSRLDEYLPDIVDKLTYRDHSEFDLEFLEKYLEEKGGTSFLVTQKDYVKLEDSNLPISLMRLSLKIEPHIIKKIDSYIKEHKC